MWPTKSCIQCEQPICVAISSGNADRAQELLEAEDSGFSQIFCKNSRCPPFMYSASVSCSISVVKLLLEFGVDINSEADNVILGTHTALHRLAFVGGQRELEMAKFLINSGANVTLKSGKGHTSLYVAVRRGHPEFAELLLESGACREKELSNILVVLALNTDRAVQMLRVLSNYVTLAIVEDRLGNNAFHWLCSTSHAEDPDKAKEIVKFLQKARVSIDKANNSGKTPLHQAIITGKSILVEIYLKKGANFTLKEEHGSTALHLACELERNHMISKLLEAGADINEKNSLEKTPIEVIKNPDSIAMEIVTKHLAKMYNNNEFINVNNQGIVYGDKSFSESFKKYRKLIPNNRPYFKKLNERKKLIKSLVQFFTFIFSVVSCIILIMFY